MRKKHILISIFITVVMLLSIRVRADSSGDVTLKSSKDTIKAGEEFTITISANSENGLNGLNAKMEYDETKLQVIKSEPASNENWAEFDSFPQITTMWKNSNSDTNSSDIYVVTFKAKDNISAGELNIKLTEITLSTNGDDITINDKTKKIEITKANTETPSNGGDNNNNDNNTNGNINNGDNKNQKVSEGSQGDGNNENAGNKGLSRTTC